MMHEPALNSSFDKDQTRRMLINLTITSQRVCHVRSCEISGKTFRNRTTFGDRAYLDIVFCEPVAEAIRECLASLQGKTEVLAIPSFLIEVPGLTLVGVHLMVTKLKDEGFNIIMRFGSFIGGINRLYAHNVGFDAYIADHTAALAAQVIEDIAIPLLDICAFNGLDTAHRNTQLGQFGTRLSQKSHDVLFRIDLLKRFIEQEADSRETHQFGRLHTAPSIGAHAL